MPHTPKTRARAYQKMKKRRADFFEGKTCVKCGSKEFLELDHIDPAKKKSHKVWSWSDASRKKELRKCQILCAKCHKEKTKLMLFRPLIHGKDAGYHRGCKCPECRAAHNRTCGRNGVNAVRIRQNRLLSHTIPR
jgi:hypothetical protein